MSDLEEVLRREAAAHRDFELPATADRLEEAADHIEQQDKRIAELEDMLRLCKQLMTEPDEELSDDLYWHIAKLIKEKDNE